MVAFKTNKKVTFDLFDVSISVNQSAGEDFSVARGRQRRRGVHGPGAFLQLPGEQLREVRVLAHVLRKLEDSESSF
jgi:hypothetical protein